MLFLTQNYLLFIKINNIGKSFKKCAKILLLRQKCFLIKIYKRI